MNEEFKQIANAFGMDEKNHWQYHDSKIEVRFKAGNTESEVRANEIAGYFTSRGFKDVTVLAGAPQEIESDIVETIGAVHTMYVAQLK